MTARTTLEAMISHSDNTAADMALQHVGPERVRDLIASLGLAQTRIPESTRLFIAYAFGDPDWQAITWPRLLTLLNDDPFPHRPVINDTISMASSPRDLVAFYTLALQGELFRYAETLAIFRAITGSIECVD